MGKIVKYCAACEEGFAEKFAFCPNCGGALTAYELNPVTEKAAASVKNSEPENLKAETFAPAAAIVPTTTEASFAETNPVETETVAFSSNGNKGDEKILDDEYLPEETASFNAPAASNGNGNGNGFHADDFSSQHQYQTNLQTDDYSRNDSGGFHVTVIEEKNSGIRNALLLGAFVFVITVTLAGVVASLFTKELYAAGVPNTDLMNAMLLDDIPAEVEEVEKKKDNDKGGGGGGGGKEDEDEVSKGTPPRQTDVQLNPPSAKVPQFNAELKYDMSTIGKRDIKRTEEPIGNPFGQSGKLSDGPGKGGGMGTGTGTGFGSGRGGGAGSGIGTGNGGGIGDGDGDDSGPGSGGNAPPPLKVKKPEPVGPTEPVKIISKPRANYTDAARTNNIQGVVRVRVTFLANGTIGSISPVSNLGYGLTEQALAAARSIRFEPAKKGGVPYSVTKVVEYTFTLY